MKRASTAVGFPRVCRKMYDGQCMPVDVDVSFSMPSMWNQPELEAQGQKGLEFKMAKPE